MPHIDVNSEPGIRPARAGRIVENGYLAMLAQPTQSNGPNSTGI